jgi:iron complex transport system ATP-binding protein
MNKGMTVVFLFSIDRADNILKIGLGVWMIEFLDIYSGYDQSDVLKGVSLTIKDNDFAVILGPNGAGKSTLLYTLIGYLPLRKGSILIKGKSLDKWQKKELAKVIAIIPQETVMPFDYTVEEMVLMGRYPWLELMQSWSKKDMDIVHEILSKLELTPLANRYFSQLSGGEKQRVLLARALAQQTEVILLDESLSQLDINHQIEMMQLLSEINRKEGKCIILISHHINLAANVGSHLIFLKDGKLIANGSPDEVLTQNQLKQLFGVDLTLQTNPLSNRPNLVFPGITPTP